MAQISYGYQTAKGVPGGLCDISPYSVDSRCNGEETAGRLKFGMGAVWGTIPGRDVKVPDSSSSPEEFEGVVLTSFTEQQETEGGVKLYPKQTAGILRYGRAWARVAPDITVGYGDKLYLVTSGAYAGYFTNDENDGIAVNGRFMSGADGGIIAMVEIFSAPAV